MTDNKTDHMEAEARESTRFIKENKEWINRILNDTQINARVRKVRQVSQETVHLEQQKTSIEGDIVMNKYYEDYQLKEQEREIERSNQRILFADTNGVGRLAKSMVDDIRRLGGNEKLLTAKNNEYLFPSFDRPLLTIKDAPQTLRPAMTVTALQGLRSAPILDYTTEEVAEYEGLSYANLTAGELDFSHISDRNIAEVSDTIVYCNDVGYLDETIKNILSNQVLDREMRYLTGEYQPSTPGESDRTHMNLYRTDNPIKKVTGATLLESIMTAVNDLHISLRPYATIAMNNKDYVELVTELAKIGLGSIDLRAYFGVANILINPYMKAPVVGHFKGLHANYYTEQFEFYPEHKRGVGLFVLAYSFDIRFVPQLFRIAEVV
ncbi:hypothetical protein [Macrococcus bovicus]|uniref:hypothetical protein n=1 Tax=Macrococcus bovicus TaxID=69968 RepID=UPI0025A5A431|nr:hypothetical protein [Macrococcus bovicus]WJP98445.1 hypothetical protein QSV55_03840 [Macrococcus bovicus]